jgi:hypothetical protein
MSDWRELPLDEFVERYMKPVAADLMRRVQAGEPITSFEAELIRSMGPESASWALNIKKA